VKAKLIAAAALVLIAGYGVATIGAPARVASAPAKPAPRAAAAVPAPKPAPKPAPAEAVDSGTLASPEAPSAAQSDDVRLDEGDVPVTVRFAHERVMGVRREYVVVQAVADSVVVNGVKLNRGNCSAAPSPQSGVTLPATLKFGQAVTLVIGDCDRVLEVAVDTDTGEHTFGG
jgi:hypothetical protein